MAYRGKDIPTEYAIKEAEAKQKHIEEWRNKKKGISSGEFTLSGLFGGSTVDGVSEEILFYQMIGR
jgi:import inner membrane translocase subunit TIM50